MDWHMPSTCGTPKRRSKVDAMLQLMDFVEGMASHRIPGVFDEV